MVIFIMDLFADYFLQQSIDCLICKNSEKRNEEFRHDYLDSKVTP